MKREGSKTPVKLMMKAYWNHLFGWVLILVLLMQSGSALSADGLRVMVSIKPIHSLVSALMQGGDPPELVVAEGELPFGYQLSEAQRSNLSKADLLIWTGPELEPFLVGPAAELEDSDKSLELLDHPALKILPSRWNNDRRDPFFWMDTRNALILIDELARVLIDLDPVRTHLYLRNRAELQSQIAELDRRFEYGYRGLTGSALIYHDSLQYFEQAYALRFQEVLSPLMSGR